jgi:hypothetical protein
VIGKEAIIRKEAANNEETVIREKVAVKILESAVDKSTTNESWTVKSPTLKTHITALKSDWAKRQQHDSGGKIPSVPR